MFKKNVGNCGFSVKHEKKIWYGRRYAGYRRRFAEGDVKGMICACCRKQLPQKKESLRLNIQRFEV